MLYSACMDELSKIIGTEARVKIMRLFLFNEDEVFAAEEVAQRSKVPKKTAQTEVRQLEKANFLLKKPTTIQTESKTKSGKTSVRNRKAAGYILNTKMSLVEPLRNLLIDVGLITGKDLIKRFAKTGRIKLLALAGVFVDSEDSLVDIMVIGDNIKKPKVEAAIHDIEAEIGKELRYAIFETSEFRYRLEMFDKLVRNVFDYEHEILVDKLALNYKR